MGIGIGNWKIKSMKYDAKYATAYRVLFMHIMISFKLQLNQEFWHHCFLYYSYCIHFYVFIKHKIYNNTDVLKYFIILLMILVYTIDTLLNFPIARPISHIFLIFMSIGLMFLANKYEKNNI